MKGNFLISIFAASMVYSCGNTNEKTWSSSDIATTLTTGSWKTTEMFIQYTSYRDSDKDSILFLNDLNYQDVMGSTQQTIQFQPNGEYIGVALNLRRQDTIKSLGNWQAGEGTLTIDFGVVRNEYQVVELDDNLIKLKGVIDLDGDKATDDQVEFSISRIY